MDNCALCGSEITNENAPVLTMGGYGVPRYLCDNCAEQIEVATTAKSTEAIAAAVKALGQKLSMSDHDNATNEAMTEILDAAMKRGKAIKDGTYDFSLDGEEPEEVLEDIPEELLETEEDKKLDKEEEEKTERANNIFTWISIIIFSALGAFALYRLLDFFVF